MRIAVDAMGSDAYPAPDIEGAIQAAREYPDTHIIWVGVESVIRQELTKHDTTGVAYEIVHTDQFVTMTDKPSRVIREKPQSSMAVGMQLVKDGQADAFVTAGNTGAVLSNAILHVLKRIRNVMRPTLPGVIPVKGGQFFILDSGANADCRPEWLVQFGIIGSIYVQRVHEVESPRVALLSNGEEEGKGNDFVHKTAELLAAGGHGLNYIGSIEPKEAVRGVADIILTDGFTGNVMLKSMEAAGMVVFDLIRENIALDMRSKVGAALARPAFRRVYHRIDPFEVGGIPLLGVNGVVVTAHGRTNAKGIKNAIRQARVMVSRGIVAAITERMAQL